MWKDIRGYEGYYQVSDEGKVRRLKSGGKTREVKNKDGLYYTVSLSKKCEKRTYAVHRLVAEMFIPRPVWNVEVNHKDGNKHNNHVENLEWVTQRENLAHAENVLGKPMFGKKARSCKCLDAKTGKLIKEYASISEAARDVAADNFINARVSITSACIGSRKTALGYRWKYTN